MAGKESKENKESKKPIGSGVISEMDRYLFGNGTHYEIYEKLGHA